MTTTTSDTATSVTTPKAPRRRVVRAMGAAAVLVVVAGGVAWGLHRHAEVGTAPYVDPASAGRITLCHDGKAVTSGSTTGTPFADAVIGGQAAEGELAVGGGTATLFAYQPRQGIDPVSWSGLQLTGASSYADAATPTVVPEEDATTLAQFLTAFPATDGGWVQLRVILGAPGVRAQTTSYATVDLHVRGATWTVVNPGTATCPAS